MPQNVNIYVPNQGEINALKALIKTRPQVLGLYKNQALPDGNITIDQLTEMASGGGRGYARKELSIDLVESLTADKWYAFTNALGRAEAAYSNAVQKWDFNSYDVADLATVFGVFAFCWVLPFDAGNLVKTRQPQIGDTIKGVTSGATGIIADIEVISGSWAADTAAGYLYIMTKTGTFQNNEDLIISGEVGTLNATPTAGGTGYAVGDLVEIVTGGTGALVIVTAQTGGVVDSVALAFGGKGYTTGTGKATAKITGSGNDDLTVNITALASDPYAVSNTGATADAHRHLQGIWAFASGQAITQNGQSVTWDHKIAMATGT